MKGRLRRAAGVLAAILIGTTAHGAGTLTPVGSADAPIAIRDHHVDVRILDGFARTQVEQTFFNPNDEDLEAVYAFPIPKSASLAEMTVVAGEQEIHGEVIARDRAEQIYRDETDRGADAGLATKNGYQSFEFRISRVPAGAETRMRFSYYQPLEIDTGVGRYLYPLEEGGTDEAATSFWTRSVKVERSFSLDIELLSSWPIAEVRLPGFQAAAQVERKADGHWTVRIDEPGGTLEQDVMLYYRLADELPGRVEIVAFRDDPNKPGTFMAVVTPGLDLRPLDRGADYVFVLDTSGSMSGGKIQTLARGVERALGEMDGSDRFRIVTFSSSARDLTRGFKPATPENAKAAIAKVAGLGAGGSTNLYDGLDLGLDDLDDDRATSVILVTDAVTNTGVVDPASFHALLRKVDVRIFGFLMGNSSNWPLMRTIANASGGFYAGVSNADDLVGQIMLAKSKVTHEALHDAELRIRGVRTQDVTGEVLGKVYRGQQLVLFGRYEQGGRARIALKARLTGEDKTYTTEFEFPELDTDYPELERLWAMSRVEELEASADAGLLDGAEAEHAIRDLGVGYQIVTDETAMVVLADAAFQRHGIDRKNQTRLAREQLAQAERASKPVRNHRVDQQQPMFEGRKASRLGGGAIDPLSALIAVGIVGAAWGSRRRREQ